jgi:O-antigen/teichoic acid export membrane protein
VNSFLQLLFSSFSGVVTEKIVGVLAAIASNHLFANIYGARLFGELQFALSLAYVVGSVALIFSAPVIAPIFGKHRRLRHMVFYHTFRLRLILSLAVMLVFMGVVALTMPSSSASALTLIAALVLTVEPLALGSVMAYAETKPWVITRAKAYASGVRVLWLLAAAHASVGAVIAAFAWPLEACVAAVAPFSRYRMLAFSTPRAHLGNAVITRTLVMRGLKIWPAIAASVIMLRMDRLLLGMLMSKADLGIYAAAASLVEQWNSVGTTLALALAPSMVYVARNEQQLRLRSLKLALWLAIVGIFAAIACVFMGERLFLIIYGPQFIAGVPVMIYATFCAVATFADAGLSAWLVAAQRYRLIVTKQTITVAAIAAAPFILPRSLMMYAPATGTAVSLVLFWAVTFGFSLHHQERA